MNKKKLIIIILSVLFVLCGLSTYIYLTREDKNTSLNMIEKKWIDSNKKQLLDISIFNDIPALSYHGKGVAFEFLKSLENNTGLEFNKVSYNIGDTVKTDLSFNQKNDIEEKDILIYEDNYVLITNSDKYYNNPTEIDDMTIGVVNDNLDKVNTYLLGADVNFRTFENADSMILALINNENNLDGVVVPKLQYLEKVLSSESLSIAYNITEYKNNYVLTLGSNNTLNSILTKYYKKWSSINFNSEFNSNLISNYFAFTGEESQNNAKLHSKRYVYGFIENKPYDVLTDGELIGINSSIIADFTDVSSVVVEYKQYKNYEDLINAFNANEIDFFLELNGQTEYKMDIYRTVSPFKERLMIFTNNKKDIIVNSINSLSDYTVSVLKGSRIAEVLKKYDIKLKEYNTTDEIIANKKADVIALDYYNYQYYISKGLKNYILSYDIPLDSEYNYVFRDIKDNEQFEMVFDFYLAYDQNIPVISRGITNSLNINLTSLIIRNIIITISIILVIGLIILIVVKLKNRKHKHNSNLSKGDKLKYIDRLTSLKNRNYLNDNIEIWDESEVYPQTIIIVDLNDIAYINDNYGHSEGDLVIKEAANILIKNQLANSEIIRTNGNEFLIYLVSYDEKQVISYIRRLNKEFKELAHGFGAAIGYSVINDAIKTIDDAVNEATIDMRNNKDEASKE